MSNTENIKFIEAIIEWLDGRKIKDKYSLEDGTLIPEEYQDFILDKIKNDEHNRESSGKNN